MMVNLDVKYVSIEGRLKRVHNFEDLLESVRASHEGYYRALTVVAADLVPNFANFIFVSSLGRQNPTSITRKEKPPRFRLH